MRRRRYYGRPLQKNDASFSTSDALLVVGGVAVLGTFAYLLWKSQQDAKQASAAYQGVLQAPAQIQAALQQQQSSYAFSSPPGTAATDINPPPLPPAPPGGVPLPVAPSA